MEFERPVKFNPEASSAWGNYYSNKAKVGSGLSGYHADIFQRGSGGVQRGDGLWDSIVRLGMRFGLPIVKYLGPKVAETVVGASADALQGENFVESLKAKGKEQAKGIDDELVKKAGRKLSGGGRKLKSRSQFGFGQKRRRVSKGRGKRKVNKKEVTKYLKSLLG